MAVLLAVGASAVIGGTVGWYWGKSDEQDATMQAEERRLEADRRARKEEKDRRAQELKTRQAENQAAAARAKERDAERRRFADAFKNKHEKIANLKECLMYQNSIVKQSEQELIPVKQKLGEKQAKLADVLSEYIQTLDDIQVQHGQLLKRWLNFGGKSSSENPNINAVAEPGAPGFDTDVQDEKFQDEFNQLTSGLDLDDSINTVWKLRKQISEMTTLICVGKSGTGKSTALNRMCGDTSRLGNKGPFVVGCMEQAGTHAVSHLSVEIKIAGKKKRFLFVDTPGLKDPDGAATDTNHKNNIAHYLSGAEGINAVVVLISITEERFTGEYIEVFEALCKMFNDRNWWNRVIIIGTKVDRYHTILEDYWKPEIYGPMTQKNIDLQCTAKMERIVDKLRSVEELKIPKDALLPFIIIGKNSYKQQIDKLLSELPRQKYRCDNIVSPLSELQEKATKQESDKSQLEHEISLLLEHKKTLDSTIQRAKQAIPPLQQKLQHLKNQ